MSLLGYDSFGTETINGLNNLNCNTLYSDTIYIDNSTTPINVNDKLDQLQAEIDAIETELIGIASGYYFLGASSNNPNNTLSEKKLYFNQTPASNGFTLVGSGTSATQITATYDGVYQIYYKINYQKVNATTAYEVRTWIMKNGVDIDYTTTIQTMDASAQWMQVSNQYIVTLNAGDYLEVVWYSPNANASSDILDFIGASAPYPQVSSQTVCVTQIMNVGQGHSDVIAVGSTTTLAAGSSAYVTDTTTINPTYTLHTLAFGIPKGDKGDKGDTGNTGPQGPQGPQGPKGDAGDGPIAIAALALATTANAGVIANTASIVGLNASQAVQDAQITTQGINISILQDKCQGFQYVNSVPNYGVIPSYEYSCPIYIQRFISTTSPPAVALYQNQASSFNYGITSSDLISTTDRFQSTSGQSSFSSVIVNADLEVGTTSSLIGSVFIGRSSDTQKKIVLYDNNTGNNYDFQGIYNTPNNFNFSNMNGGDYRFYFGNGLGTNRSVVKSITATDEQSYTPASTFLKSAGASQQIQLVRDTPNNKVRIDLIGDTAGVNQFDGQIIQEEGNGLDDNKGTMTIQSGGLILNALNAGIQTNSTLSSSFQATTTMNIQSGTDMTLTSGDDITLTCNTGTSGILQSNCKIFDVNALNSIELNAGTNGLNLETTGVLNLTSTMTGSTDAINITTNTSTGYDLVLNNTTQTNFSISCKDNLSISTPPTRSIEIDAGSGGLDLSTEGLMTLTGNTGIDLTTTTGDIIMSATDMTIGTTTGAVTVNSASGGGFYSTTGTLTLKANAGDIILDAYGVNDIEGATVNITSSSSFNTTSNSDTNITSTTGDINLNAINGVINMTATNTYITNASQTDGLATFNGGFTSTASSNMNHNFLIQQNNYSGFSSTSQIGYTVSTTFDCGTVNSTLTNETSFTLPSKGVWLIICGHEWISASSNTIQNKQLYFSSVAGLSGNTGIGNGLEYFEEINDNTGGASTRQKLTMSGVVVITSATTVYVNAKADVDTGTRPTCKLEYSYTRLG
jgi:hypothetical protein